MIFVNFRISCQIAIRRPGIYFQVKPTTTTSKVIVPCIHWHSWSRAKDPSAKPESGCILPALCLHWPQSGCIFTPNTDSSTYLIIKCIFGPSAHSRLNVCCNRSILDLGQHLGPKPFVEFVSKKHKPYFWKYRVQTSIFPKWLPKPNHSAR